MSNLLKLLQPKEYKSKLKLFCRETKLEVKSFGSIKTNPYICKTIEIKEI
jgi:hypothetical protein